MNMLPVPTYLTAFTAPVIMDTPVMDLPAQVRHLCRSVRFYQQGVDCNTLYNILGYCMDGDYRFRLKIFFYFN